jgi:hypothetical protein
VPSELVVVVWKKLANAFFVKWSQPFVSWPMPVTVQYLFRLEPRPEQEAYCVQTEDACPVIA